MKFVDNVKIGKHRFHLMPALVLLTATIAVYGRILWHDFLFNWDDYRYVVQNHTIQGVTWDHVRAVFSTYYVGNYAPVQMLSYMADYWLWGLWPGGFLLTNLLVHALNGLLIYRLLLRLHGDRLMATVGAAVFLLHPVQVESVAWISQRKNLLAMLFFLLAWEGYCRYRQAKGSGRSAYAASFVALVLALLSKSVAVIFPLVIVLYDICFPDASKRVRLLDKIPFIMAAAGVAVVALISQTPDYSEWGGGGGRTGYHGGSPVVNFFTMLPVFCRYLGLLVWPAGLSADYDPGLHTGLDATVAGAVILLAVLFLLSVRLFKYDRKLGFWPLFFLVGLLPVSQIVPLVTLMNDRYLYFPMIAVAALSGAGAQLLQLRMGPRRKLLYLLIAVPLVLLSVVSYQRVSVWQNAVTLWRDAVVKSPNKSIVWEGLGEACHFSAPGLKDEALKAYQRALGLDPAADMSRYNMGLLYADWGDLDKAYEIFTDLLRRSPLNVMGWAALGDIYLRRENYSEAGKAYKRAQALQPDAVQVLKLLGNLAVLQGGLDEALRYYCLVEMRQGGDDPLTAYQLAGVEAMAGQTTTALVWLERALQRGYDDYQGLMADEELAPIRADGRFTVLMQRYIRK